MADRRTRLKTPEDREQNAREQESDAVGRSRRYKLSLLVGTTTTPSVEIIPYIRIYIAYCREKDLQVNLISYRRWLESMPTIEKNAAIQVINAHTTKNLQFIKYANNYLPDTGLRKRTRKRKRRNSKRR
jgi:hypothetical protein